MKRYISIITITALFLGCVSFAFAASPSFNDVPAKHWAYDAVNQLIKADIIEGYRLNDDRLVSRYEFAFMVQKAINKYNQANDVQKAVIDKLTAEFASELNKLDARVTSSENNSSKTKVHGELRSRYEWSKAPASGALGASEVGKGQFRIRARLLVDGQITDSVTYHANYEAENFAGVDTGYPGSTPNKTDNKADLVVGFIDAKTNWGFVDVGRMGMGLGYGLLTGSPKWDGIRVGGGDNIKWIVGTARRNSGWEGLGPDANTWRFANVSTNIGTVNVFAAYMGEKDKTNYNTTAAGISFKATPEVKITSEYAKNDVKANDKPYAWYLKAQYRGAKQSTAGSFGVWAQYKRAQPDFDKYGMSDPYTMAIPWTANYPSPGGNANDMKGTEYGVEYTVFKDGILSVRYDDLTNYAGKVNKKYMITELNVFF